MNNIPLNSACQKSEDGANTPESRDLGTYAEQLKTIAETKLICVAFGIDNEPLYTALRSNQTGFLYRRLTVSQLTFCEATHFGGSLLVPYIGGFTTSINIFLFYYKCVYNFIVAGYRNFSIVLNVKKLPR